MFFNSRRVKRWMIAAMGMLALTMALSAIAQTASLAPNQLGSGQLPSGYSRITFTLANGNWTGAIHLPAKPRNGDQVEIISTALYPSSLSNFRTDLPIKSLDIRNGDRFLLTYLSGADAWTISGSGIAYLSPNDSGADMSGKSKRITVYTMADANWLRLPILPSHANDGDLLLVRSRATYTASIDSSRTMYASTMRLATGDSYAFKYLSAFGKWVLIDATTRQVNARTDIPTPATARTSMQLYDGSWVGSVRLPAQAGDRDRIRISSTATWNSRIENSGNAPTEPMQLKRGQAYEFMYVKERQRWVSTSAPDTYYLARNLPNGVVPSLTTPRTFIDVGDANFWWYLSLPDQQAPGTRVVVRTSAQYGFQVIGSGIRHAMSTGEMTAFVVDGSRKWKRETVTIDLLLLYSDKAAAKFGESAMRAHLLESFALTNEALENSGANFRFRAKSIRKIEASSSWKDLGGPLRDLRDHPRAQAWRNELRADGIYYVGTEEGCGLAWIHSSADYMVATGSTNCGTTVMRHELGHNMGLAHGGESSSYNQGDVRFGTIMAGNGIPFYATPDRYDPATGIPLGTPDRIDATRAMNEFSKQVANYR
ncbi:M12 family metallo-peptidase [Dyella sp. 2RAB6]|uniref:M12 family metallo-peptidase n=1 Tax=Dyella sp. 2RAB6 TaxID=3232992 RepID=UPI003F8DECBE